MCSDLDQALLIAQGLQPVVSRNSLSRTWRMAACLASFPAAVLPTRMQSLRRMKRTTLYLKEEQLKKLEAISAKTGAPVAELIRRAIDAYLQKAR